MGKRKRQSKTIRDNSAIIFLTALSGGILLYSSEIREAVPNWIYIPLMVSCGAYNIWRRTRTSEPLK